MLQLLLGIESAYVKTKFDGKLGMELGRKLKVIIFINLCAFSDSLRSECSEPKPYLQGKELPGPEYFFIEF